MESSQHSLESLLHPALENPRNIQGMYQVAQMLVQAIQAKREIVIVGDYDSDGLNASAILVKLLQYYSITPAVIIPRRMSEGYGLSSGIVARIPENSFVMTIDNGITAIEQIEALKQKGCTVVILDHHLPISANELPPADIIVDPHVSPEKNGFEHYCGAGLGLQLARLMLELEDSMAARNLEKELTVHAAIATITDVMPLVDGNRKIVMDGLALLNDSNMGAACGGLAALRVAANSPVVTEESIGYKIGPLINAPARLYDAGGASVLKALVCKDFTVASGYLVKMQEINNRRKELVKEYARKAKTQIEQGQSSENPKVICFEDAPEGILGIIAGQLCDELKTTTFVLAKTTIDGMEAWKGSARAYGNDDLSVMLDAVRPITINCGGHKGAAGVSVSTEYLQAFIDTLQEVSRDTIPTKEVFYDLELQEHEVRSAESEQRQFAPFGEGVQKPTVRISHLSLENPREIAGGGLKCWNETHHFDIIGFGLYPKYQSLGSPKVVDCLCTLGTNTFNGKTTVQINVIDLNAAE